MGFVRVASFAEITEGATLGVHVGSKPVCLVRLEDEVYAFADNCSHRDFPLSNGEVDPDDCSITCEWHGARFDIRTGAALSLPATRPVPTFACKVEDGEIFVDIG